MIKLLFVYLHRQRNQGGTPKELCPLNVCPPPPQLQIIRLSHKQYWKGVLFQWCRREGLGGGGGGQGVQLPPPPLFGHVCTLNERKGFFIRVCQPQMLSSSIKIYASDYTRSCLRARKHRKKILGGGGGGGGGGGHAPRPP